MLAVFLYMAISWSAAGVAHDFWIEPSAHRLAQPGEVSLTLREGVDMSGDSLPYITQWFEDFSVTDSNGRRRVRSTVGDDPAAVVMIDRGTSLVGYLSTRNFVEIGPRKFNRYLEEEDLGHVLALRRRRGETRDNATEYFVRCAKSLIGAGDGSNDRVFETRLGYTLELIPRSNPLSLKTGEPLQVQLLYRDEPLADTRVRAISSDRPEEKVDQRTDDNGVVNLRLPHRGVWLIKAVHIIELKNDERARWESYWASLTLEIL